MSFIRGKTSQTKKYGPVTHYYLVENYRDGGKVRQRVLAYLGDYSTTERAIQHYQTWLTNNMAALEVARRELADISAWFDRAGVDPATAQPDRYSRYGKAARAWRTAQEKIAFHQRLVEKQTRRVELLSAVVPKAPAGGKNRHYTHGRGSAQISPPLDANLGTTPGGAA